MRTVNKKFRRGTFSGGSALILAVVLTSLLAIIGVLFVMTTRIDKIGTSAISENKELDFAVETVIAKISRELALDVPSVANQEYYDYPGPDDPWLGTLEPSVNDNGTPTDSNDDIYYWRQISDVTGYLDQRGFQIENVNVEPPGTRKYIHEYAEIKLIGAVLQEQLADADGDHVADSKWIELGDITSGKGKPIYAAIRIIDNGAMLNVNTAYKFDRADPCLAHIDGSSLMQINLTGLARGLDDVDEIHIARCGYGNPVWEEFQKNMVWRIYSPATGYLPFDISDELELRYRYCLNWKAHNRLEDVWYDTIGSLDDFQSVPYDGSRNKIDHPKKWRRLDDWCKRITRDPNAVEPDTRHLLTTYNMDRIINPAGSELNNGKMINVNMADESLLYEAINAGLLDVEPNFMVVDTAGLAAQLAVNIADHRDDDTEVTYLPVGQTMYYGFETQPFISEIAFSISQTDANNSTNNEFAIELYNPFDVDILLGNFRLELRRQDGTVVSTINLTGYGIANGNRFVVTNGAAASNGFGVVRLMRMGGGKEDPNLVLATYLSLDTDPPTYALNERYDIYLLRTTSAEDIYLDKQQTEDEWFNWDTIKGTRQSYCRSDNNWNIVYQDLQSAAETLGGTNGLSAGRRNYNLENSVGPFVTVGDIARVLKVGPSADPCDMIGMQLATEPGEEDVRLDLQNPAFANIFQYLTVIDPASHGRRKYETRIKGRVNVNTAPWFVIAQLPWMEPVIAREMVTYRDTIAGGFESIGVLMQIPLMGYYAYDPLYSSVDLDRFPDLTPSDGAVSDFEERDVIFSRISNLVTVRSDVFTAYILVRIGIDGPQRRVIAILDRSQANSPSDRVKIVALHPVPDPR